MKALNLFFLLAAAFGYADFFPLPPPIRELPPESHQARAESEIRFFHLDYIGRTLDARDWYRLALLHIEARQWKEARDALAESTKLDPCFDRPFTQRGYLDLWEGDSEAASIEFRAALDISPCNEFAIDGMQQAAIQWSKENRQIQQAIQILREANGCRPRNLDTLFYLGRLLALQGNLKEAEAVLNECLEIAPHQEEAQLQLGFVYERQGKYEQAEQIFRKLPGNLDARRGQARCLAGRLQYKQARNILRRFPHKSSDDWALSMDVRSHTNPALFLETTYTQAKEDDPSLKVPVVKDYYFYNALNIWVPIFNRWRIDLKQITYHQRENEILVPTAVNYNVYIWGAQLTSRYFFMKDWTWDVALRYLQGYPKGQMVYPFEPRAPFEPGVSLQYNGPTHFFRGDAHVESMIIKNFSIQKSQLLRLDYTGIGYAFHPDLWLHPKVEGWVSGTYYHDAVHNWKNQQIFEFKSDLPGLSPYVRFLYRFEHADFKYLTPNYFTYLRQIENWVGGILRYEFAPWAALEIDYVKSWQLNRNVILPVGSFIFISPRLFLMGDRVKGRYWMRLWDKMQFEIEGHFFRNTLPYRDWNLRGSLLYQF